MESEHFYDFDAFAESVRGVESRMMLQNPRRHSWRTHLAYMAGVRVQMGQLGSGNIVEGQTAAEGCLLYLPLTDECEYSANGLRIAKDAFMILEPGSEFCVSTKFEHDWCTIAIPAHILDLELEHGGEVRGLPEGVLSGDASRSSTRLAVSELRTGDSSHGGAVSAVRVGACFLGGLRESVETRSSDCRS